STAAGTAINAYSGSKTSARKHMMISGHTRNISGTQMWGAESQARQRHTARMAKGQVGHRNQGRSRRRLSRTSCSGSTNERLFQSHQFCAQYGYIDCSGTHHASPINSAMAALNSSQARRGHKAPAGWKAKRAASMIGSEPIHPRVRNAAPNATPSVMDPESGRSMLRATA